MPPLTVGGMLTDFNSGQELSAGVEITALGEVDGAAGASQVPNTDTPADQIFSGKVDWRSSALYFAGSGAGSALKYTFTNLYAGARYRFRGTAVRGNNYLMRWTVATLEGASNFRPAHQSGPESPGIVTNGWAVYGDKLQPETQASWNSGHNLCGDVIGWDDIVPLGLSFSVVCSNWAEPTPGGAGNTSYAYGFSAMQLIELAELSPIEIVNEPADLPAVTLSEPFSLSIQTVGSSPRYQWYRGTPPFGTPIAGAAGPTYAVGSAQPGDAGSYYVVVTNDLPSSATSRAVWVNVVLDLEPPQLISAVRLLDLTNILVTYSEAMHTNALLSTNYQVCTDATLSDCLRIPHAPGTNGDDHAVIYFTNGASQVVIATDAPEDPHRKYRLFVRGVSDQAGNWLGGSADVETSTSITLPEVRSFQQGIAGYAGTVDTWIDADHPDATYGTQDLMDVDNLAPRSQGLMRFNDLFGAGPGQVPPGAAIRQATLTCYTLDPGNDISLHQMLVDWTASSSWNSLENGVATNDTEAGAAVVTTVHPRAWGQFVDIDVTSSVHAWASGSPNHGWLFVNTGAPSGGAWDLATSEHSSVAWRPRLTVILQPRLFILRSATAIISWIPDSGVLQASDNPTGPWMDSANQDNPQSIPMAELRQLYRIRE